jgi:hypothetical protein
LPSGSITTKRAGPVDDSSAAVAGSMPCAQVALQLAVVDAVARPHG